MTMRILALATALALCAAAAVDGFIPYEDGATLDDGSAQQVTLDMGEGIMWAGRLLKTATIYSGGQVALGAPADYEFPVFLEQVPREDLDHAVLIVPAMFDAVINNSAGESVYYSEVTDDVDAVAAVAAILLAQDVDVEDLGLVPAHIFQATWVLRNQVQVILAQYAQEDRLSESSESASGEWEDDPAALFYSRTFLIVLYGKTVTSSIRAVGIDNGDGVHGYLLDKDQIASLANSVQVFRMDSEFEECGDGLVEGIEECDDEDDEDCQGCRCASGTGPDGLGSCSTVAVGLMPCGGYGYSQCTDIFEENAYHCHWCNEGGCLPNWGNDGWMVSKNSTYLVFELAVEIADDAIEGSAAIFTWFAPSGELGVMGLSLGPADDACLMSTNGTTEIVCVAQLPFEVVAGGSYVMLVELTPEYTVLAAASLDSGKEAFVQLGAVDWLGTVESGWIEQIGDIANPFYAMAWSELPIEPDTRCDEVNITDCNENEYAPSWFAYPTEDVCLNGELGTQFAMAYQFDERSVIQAICMSINVDSDVMPYEDIALLIKLYEADANGLPGVAVSERKYDLSYLVNRPGPFQVTLDLTQNDEHWDVRTGMWFGLEWANPCPQLEMLTGPADKRRDILGEPVILDPTSGWVPASSVAPGLPVLTVDVLTICPDEPVLFPHNITYPPSLRVSKADDDVWFYVSLPGGQNRYDFIRPYFISKTGPTGLEFTTDHTGSCEITWAEAFSISLLMRQGSPTFLVVGEWTQASFRLVVEWTETVGIGALASGVVPEVQRTVQSPLLFRIFFPRHVSDTANVTIADSRVLWAYIERSFVRIDATGLPTFDLHIVTQPLEDDLIIDEASFVVSALDGNVTAVTKPELIGQEGQRQTWTVTVTLGPDTACRPGPLDGFQLGWQFTGLTEVWSPTAQDWTLDFGLTVSEDWCAAGYIDLNEVVAIHKTYTSSRWLHVSTKYLLNSLVYGDIEPTGSALLAPTDPEIEQIIAFFVKVEGGAEMTLLKNATPTADGTYLRFTILGTCKAAVDQCYSFWLAPDRFAVGQWLSLTAEVSLIFHDGTRRTQTVTEEYHVTAKGMVKLVAPQPVRPTEQKSVGDAVVVKFASPAVMTAAVLLGCLPVFALIAALMFLSKRRAAKVAAK